MLRDLFVNNLAVIDEASVCFGGGLNVLTGETGAGKSIVVDSLALLSGVRASSELIRAGAETLSVSGFFEPVGGAWRGVLEGAGLEASGDAVVVRREINRAGRNRVYLNDQPVTLGLLSRLAPMLIRIHTQREELGLVSPELQRDWLDRSGGAAAGDLLDSVGTAFSDYQRLASRLERLQGDDRLRRERIDLLEFQCGEIDAARLVAGEDLALRAEREALRHSEAITAALGSAYGALFDEEGAATERLSTAVRRLEEIAQWESHSDDWLQELESLVVGVEELAREIRQSLDGVDRDPARLDQIEERLTAIDRLSQKYGSSVTDILELRQAIGEELEDLRGDREQRDELEAAVARALEIYCERAVALSTERRRWAEALTAAIHREMAELALGKARFAVELSRRERQESPLVVAGSAIDFGAWGIDQVTYRLAANPGEEMTDLASGASGGELSRIYLALQLAIRADGPAATPVLVFDEVDAGIGGAQAAALGRKLARLAQGGQVLAVTHLPQVASHGDRHFRVEKRIEDGRTRTRVVDLDHAARVKEVARMLAGKSVTELSLSHAEEMITTAGHAAS